MRAMLGAAAVVAAITFGVSPSLAAGENPHGDLSMECATCHTPDSWNVSESIPGFDHSDTGYDLVGNHQTVPCASCHADLVFERAATECVDCHVDVHQEELGADCEKCHSPVSWSFQTAVLEEHTSAGFPLLGRHATVECEACHESTDPREFTNTPVECEGCHLEDYHATLEPDHMAVGFDITCENCHSPVRTVWQPVTFNHPPTFPLVGGHATDCMSCHTEGAVPPVDCVSCHRNEYDGAEPNHVLAGFPEDCAVCHTTFSWEGAQFAHAASFPLLGQHAQTECASCHTPANPNPDVACMECHRSEYDTAEPNHVLAGFPEECASCHGFDNWDAQDFVHPASFPLLGQHAQTDCASCHTVATPNPDPACIQCHQADYLNASPDHVLAGFPEECANCHGFNNWDAQAFVHPASFPLLGQHGQTDCASCHTPANPNPDPACIECHQSDYQNAEPDHVLAGFPEDCTNCHGFNNWDAQAINHDADYFPIYSGAHRGEWNTCADCHVSPSTFTTFECIFCHEHRQSSMDSHHNEVNGYVYDSLHCFNCHPDGRH